MIPLEQNTLQYEDPLGHAHLRNSIHLGAAFLIYFSFKFQTKPFAYTTSYSNNVLAETLSFNQNPFFKS